MKKPHLCLVNSVPLELKVGPGAEVSVATSTFLEIQSHPEKPEGHLTIPGNHPLKVSNQFMCHKCVLSVYVTPSQPTLLGHSTILALGRSVQ